MSYGKGHGVMTRFKRATVDYQSGRKTRSYLPDRVCAAEDCETRLSRYNPGRFCGVHKRRSFNWPTKRTRSTDGEVV